MAGEDPVPVDTEEDVRGNEGEDGETLDAWRDGAPAEVLRTTVAEGGGDGNVSLEPEGRPVKNARRLS